MQIWANCNLYANAAIFLLVLGFLSPTNTELYLAVRPKNATLLPNGISSLKKLLANHIACLKELLAIRLLVSNQIKLFYYINRLTKMHYLCIFSFIAPNILIITYGKSHPSFVYCYIKVSCFLFIYNLNKFLQFFIHHYF